MNRERYSKLLGGCVTLLSMMLPAASCVRERWDPGLCHQANNVPVTVKIDWSQSGINTENLRVTDEVNRVSVRFFPKDGSPAFDCYLDTDVTEGIVNVPPGRYSVVIFNESIYDDNYWDGRVHFTDTESYTGFAAHAMPLDNALRAQRFPHYIHREGEPVNVEPLPLASWSLDDLEITQPTAVRTGGVDALMAVVMRRLTHRATIDVHVENLVSALSIHGAQHGFASTVYMASGTTADPSAALFVLNGRRYDPGSNNGTVGATFLSFGRTPPPESYQLDMDIVLTDGKLYTGAELPAFDVTGQVIASGGDPEIPIHLGLALPHIDTGIAVSDWGEDEQYILD
jgi:hypothetical protein